MRKKLILAFTIATATPFSPAVAGQPATAQPIQAFDREQAKSIVEKLAHTLEEMFVDPASGRAYAARLRQRLADGDYASFPDGEAFAKTVTDDLQAVRKDGHLALLVVPPDERAGPPEGEDAGPPEMEESTIGAAGWLDKAVAYIDFALFSGSPKAMAELGSFLETHRDARTLIIDTRKHRGGGLDEMDAIFSRVFAKETPLLRMDTREAVDERLASMWDRASLRRLESPDGIVRREHVAIPAGQSGALTDAKIYVLTSGRTASAAEHFTLALKRTGRATIIGEQTRGAGNYGMMTPLDADFTYAAFIPFGRTFDPDTGKGWDGIGIRPDVAVPADRALDEALKLAGVHMTAEAALAQLK